MPLRTTDENGNIVFEVTGQGLVLNTQPVNFPSDLGEPDQVLSTDGAGNLSFVAMSGGGGGDVVVTQSVLPTGAATESSLASLNGKVTAVNTGAVVISSSVLPTGAASETTLSSLNGKVTAVNTGAVVVASSALPSGAASETTLSALNTKVTAVNTGAVVVASSALPSGAATESSLASLNGKVTAVNTGAVVLAAGSAVAGKFGIDQTTPGTTNAVQHLAGTAGGWTPSHALTAASTNATSLKASAGQVGGWVFSNTNASTRYVKFYNKASAPSPASDTPVFVVAVPGGSGSAPTVVTSNNSIGIAFSTGVAFAVVGGISDTDATVVSASDMSVDILYK